MFFSFGFIFLNIGFIFHFLHALADKGTNEVVIPHAFVNFPSTTKTVLENLYPKEFPIVLPRCIRNLTYTSWNPPPRSRAMQGSLFFFFFFPPLLLFLFSASLNFHFKYL